MKHTSPSNTTVQFKLFKGFIFTEAGQSDEMDDKVPNNLPFLLLLQIFFFSLNILSFFFLIKSFNYFIIFCCCQARASSHRTV